MKRLATVFIIMSIVCFGFSGCKKCYTCTFSAGDVRQFCSKDFPDGTKGLNLTIKAYQDEGYSCTQK